MTHMPGGGCTPRVMAAEERRRPSQSLTVAASPLVTPPADRAAPGPAAPLRRPPTSLHPLPLRRGLALLRPTCGVAPTLSGRETHLDRAVRHGWCNVFVS